MIDVKIIKKPKNKATTPTVRTPGAAYGDKSVKEAVHASKADTAKMAEKAIIAEQAEHAKKADEATRADEVSLESKTLTHFLRNDIPNTAAEVVTFLKGVVAKAMSFFQGIVNKGDINNNGDITNTGNIHNAGDITNAGNIMTKNLTVTDKATFFELEIQKAKAAGGMTVNSAGSFHIDAVEETADGFACYQRAEKDGIKLLQTCEPKDQMMCSNGMNSLPQPLQGRGEQTNDGKPHAIGNHYYWRLATAAPKEVVMHTIDGKEEKCLKLVLSKTDRHKMKNESPQDVGDIPKVGDDLVQIGNRDNKERQSVMMSCAYNSFDPDLKPSYWAHYMGVNDYEISKHRYTWFAANGSNVTGNFKVQSADGGLESIEDYVKGLAGGKDTVVWHVAFSIRSITGKPGETFRVKVVRVVGDKAEEVDYAAIVAAGADLMLFGEGMGAELRIEPGVDYLTAHYGSGGYLVARVVRYGTEVTLAQDTIYADAADGRDGKDAVTYKLIPMAENALAYITEDKKKVDLKLVYKIQKAVGENVSFINLRTEGMTLTVGPSVKETFKNVSDIYGLNNSMVYDENNPVNSYVVTLRKDTDILDQRIVPVTFKPKVVFDIDTKNGTITSQIEAADGRINSVERDIKQTNVTVGNLKGMYSQLKVKSDEISLTVNNGTRPNLLWGSDLNLDGVDTTDRAAIQKHLGVVLSNDIELGNREMFEYLKGDGVSGSDAIRIKNAYKREGWGKWTNISWKDVPLKPHTRYTISVWVKFKSYGRKGRMYVDCASDDGRYCFGGYLYKEHYYDRADIDEWQRVRYVFDSGASRKMSSLFFCCIADEEEGARCEIWLCRPKLEEGDKATPWCAYDGTVEALLAGGFDIKNREFTATTDNFKVQNNKGERTFMVDKNGHINANLISAESITAQKMAQPFVEQKSFGYLMSSPSLSWYITKVSDINGGYILASELNGAVLNIYNYTTETIWFYSTFAAGKTIHPSKTVNIRVEIEPGAMFRAFGVPIKGVEMTTSEGTTTLVALAPLVPMELTSLSGDVRATYRGSVKGFLTIR